MSLISKKTGIYSRTHKPVEITDLEKGSIVMMKSKSVLDNYPIDEDSCYIVDRIPVVKEMEIALGGMLVVERPDYSDNTFSAYVITNDASPDWFWWPLELVDYVIS